MSRVYREDTYCFEKKRVKNEFTQKKKLFSPKCSLTRQLFPGAI